MLETSFNSKATVFSYLFGIFFFSAMRLIFLYILFSILFLNVCSYTFPPKLVARKSLKLLDSEVVTSTISDSDIADRVINISPRAMDHLINLKSKQSAELCLRMG